MSTANQLRALAKRQPHEADAVLLRHAADELTDARHLLSEVVRTASCGSAIRAFATDAAKEFFARESNSAHDAQLARMQ
jgi:hypothetical protein